MMPAGTPLVKRNLHLGGADTAVLEAVPIAIAEHARATTGWSLHVVQGAAHAPHIEQPARFLGALANAMGAPETHV